MADRTIYKFMVGSELVGNYLTAFEASKTKLHKLTPEFIVHHSGAAYDPIGQNFIFESFNREIAINYPTGDVSFRDQNLRPCLEWRLLLINYLTSFNMTDDPDQWTSYRLLPNGNVFYPAILQNCLQPLAQAFNNCNLQIWCEAMNALGFNTELKEDSVQAIANFVPMVPVMVKFWAGDDEVPAACQILFKTSISNLMHIEDTAALCGIIRKFIEEGYSLCLNRKEDQDSP